MGFSPSSESDCWCDEGWRAELACRLGAGAAVSERFESFSGDFAFRCFRLLFLGGENDSSAIGTSSCCSESNIKGEEGGSFGGTMMVEADELKGK